MVSREEFKVRKARQMEHEKRMQQIKRKTELMRKWGLPIATLGGLGLSSLLIVPISYVLYNNRNHVEADGTKVYQKHSGWTTTTVEVSLDNKIEMNKNKRLLFFGGCEWYYDHNGDCQIDRARGGNLLNRYDFSGFNSTPYQNLSPEFQYASQDFKEQIQRFGLEDLCKK